MIFFHNHITTLTIQTLTKNNPSDICLKPKKLYKLYKLYNVKFLLKNRKNFRNKILKPLNYKELFIGKNP